MATASPAHRDLPGDADSLLDFLDRAEPIDEEFPEIEDLPSDPLDDLFADWAEDDDALGEAEIAR